MIGPIDLVFVVLGVAVGLSYLARRLKVAEPILLLVGGLGLGLVPDLPPIALEPDLVFLLFLPPILFSAAYFTPIRDFKANARSIMLLAIGLVLFTTVVVGFVVQWLVPGIEPAVAFTLGAIVAPPDAVSATSVLRRLGVPRRVVTILEGESLINDATSLIAYRTASAAVATGAFSFVDAAGGFVLVSVGGLVVGAIAGLIVSRALYRTGDPVLEIVVVSVVAPIATYLAAQQIGVSGVLATVVAGLVTGRRASRVLSPEARLQGKGVWDLIIWLIQGFVFMLIGLQLPEILDGLADYTAGQLLWLGGVVSLTVIGVRFVWIYATTYLSRVVSGWRGADDPYPSPRRVFVVAWAGMRGVVSLAAALALAIDFPQRNLILYLTFAVIVVTLVGQGLTLPWIIRRLGVLHDDGPDSEERHARIVVAEAALRRLDELALQYSDHLPLIDQIRGGFDHDLGHVRPMADGLPDATREAVEQELLDHQAIRLAVLAAERAALLDLRDAGVINDDTERSVERDLDLEALRTAP